ncbi:NDP-hexose 2,3-dehydratase family protein [uncultured Cellulomonas sp.]|uniref:NDP-hexose 2,3-dehydratase family protein n=1 Tax=uncultured Cellulomonas sp. TaxID=189682 RepID=UPI0026143BEF|nr:NDP-hexose 2,3-dehydratase family protein [uncultured Cellulomonas sp.]
MVDAVLVPGQVERPVERPVGPQVASGVPVSRPRMPRPRPAGRADVVAATRDWLRSVPPRLHATPTRVPLDEVVGWLTDPQADDIRHGTGRFFRIMGIEAHVEVEERWSWTQPIIDQPDVGVLALVSRMGRSGLELLVQGKPEPGNPTGLQLAPTVQATRSNYMRAHGGRPVPMLDVLQAARPSDVLVDVRQSEHGTVFFRKRNRNMVVLTERPPQAPEHFRWLRLPELHHLFLADDRVNMDTRTVLSCLPWGLVPVDPHDHDPVVAALARSGRVGSPSRHTLQAILNWVTEVRSSTYVRVDVRPLHTLEGWSRTAAGLSHEDDAWFDVIGVSVEAAGREIDRWSQPMIEPHADGTLGLLVARFGDVLHVLVHLRTEPGLVDAVEIAPTVQHRPMEPADLANPGTQRHLEPLTSAPADRVLYDRVHSDEGGRFFRSANRHLIVEVDPDPAVEGPGFRWVTVHQLEELLRHSHYVNLQLRSLLSCLQAVGTIGRAPAWRTE